MLCSHVWSKHWLFSSGIIWRIMAGGELRGHMFDHISEIDNCGRPCHIFSEHQWGWDRNGVEVRTARVRERLNVGNIKVGRFWVKRARGWKRRGRGPPLLGTRLEYLKTVQCIISVFMATLGHFDILFLSHSYINVISNSESTPISKTMIIRRNTTNNLVYCIDNRLVYGKGGRRAAATPYEWEAPSYVVLSLSKGIFKENVSINFGSRHHPFK